MNTKILIVLVVALFAVALAAPTPGGGGGRGGGKKGGRGGNVSKKVVHHHWLTKTIPKYVYVTKVIQRPVPVPVYVPLGGYGGQSSSGTSVKIINANGGSSEEGSNGGLDNFGTDLNSYGSSDLNSYGNNLNSYGGDLGTTSY